MVGVIAGKQHDVEDEQAQVVHGTTPRHVSLRYYTQLIPRRTVLPTNFYYTSFNDV